MRKVVFGVAMAFLLTSCSKPLSPTYAGYKRLRLERLGFKNTVVAADLRLYNPNKYDLQLKRADAKVYFNGHLLGRTYFDTVIVLRSKDTTNVPLLLQATAKNIVTNGVRVLLNRDVKLKIEGKIKAGRHGIFVAVPVNYEGVQHLGFGKEDTRTVSSLKKELQKKIITLLLQQVKTPVQIIEVTLLMLDIVAQ